MAKKDKGTFEYKIEKVLGNISESKSSNWGKFVVRARLKDNPSTVDIRNLKVNEDGEFTIGKGVSLSNEDTDRLANLLVKLGYGDTEEIKSSIYDRDVLYGKEEPEPKQIKISIGGKKLWLSD